MKVEVWTDIHCPWCYIGKRRLEKALDQFEQRDQVQIIWRSYQLDPNAPRQYPGSEIDMLAQKYGISRQQAEKAHAQLTSLAAHDSLDFHFDHVQLGNSFDAHRLIHLAAARNLSGDVEERLMKAHFTNGLSVSDPDTLVQLAGEAGLDADEARIMLESDAYAKDVRTDEQHAASLGVNGVPFFLFDEKYAVSGAQSVELFHEALNRAWGDAPKIVEIVAARQDAGACIDESCNI
jgi:predicted DsbA family dithiol-disulfide isomerase